MNSVKDALKHIKWAYRIYYKLIGHKKEIKEIADKKKELQKNGRNIISDINNTLQNSNIDYFVDFGTLLGLVRANAFMSWDCDLDFGIIQKNACESDDMWDGLEKALKRINLWKVKSCHYQDKTIEQTYSNGVLTIDFFLHINDEHYSNVYLGFRKKGIEYNDSEYDVALLKMFKFNSTKMRDFGGIIVPVPAQPEEYLASVYTSNWRVPDPNWIPEKGPAWNELIEERVYASYY